MTPEEIRIKKLDQIDKLMAAGEAYLLAFIGAAMARPGALEQIAVRRDALLDAVDDILGDA